MKLITLHSIVLAVALASAHASSDTREIDSSEISPDGKFAVQFSDDPDAYEYKICRLIDPPNDGDKLFSNRKMKTQLVVDHLGKGVSSYLWLPKTPHTLIFTSDGAYGEARLEMWRGGKTAIRLDGPRLGRDSGLEGYVLDSVSDDGTIVEYGYWSDPNPMKPAKWRSYHISLVQKNAAPKVDTRYRGERAQYSESSEVHRTCDSGDNGQAIRSPDGVYVAKVIYDAPASQIKLYRRSIAYRPHGRRLVSYHSVKLRKNAPMLDEGIAGVRWAPHHKHTLVFAVSSVYGIPRLAMWNGGDHAITLVRRKVTTDSLEDFELDGISRDGRTVLYCYTPDNGTSGAKSYSIRLKPGSRPYRDRRYYGTRPPNKVWDKNVLLTGN